MRARFNPQNERIKLRYFEYLRHSGGKSEQTIRQIDKALRRYEAFRRYACFKTFDRRLAITFKEHLAAEALSGATILSTLNVVKRFLGWLMLQPGYKRAIRKDDIDYLNLPANEVRAATAPAEKKFPSLEMATAVIEAMPDGTDIEKRNRAIFGLLALTGVRDGALITLKLGHMDCNRKLLLQDPRIVATKFGKRIDTVFYPFGEGLERIVTDWAAHLRGALLFADSDPLFPRTKNGHDSSNAFIPVGLSRDHWDTAGPVRRIVRDAFEQAGLPPYTPHRFRDMIVAEGYRRQLSVPAFKAWSQNLGHEGAMTTLTSYGKLSFEDQRRLVRESCDEPVRPGQLMLSDIEALLDRRGL